MAVRTDLACEAYELHKNSLPDGIFQSEEWEDGLRIVTVTVETDEAGALIGKPSGRYITVETPPFSDPGATPTWSKTSSGPWHRLSPS